MAPYPTNINEAYCFVRMQVDIFMCSCTENRHDIHLIVKLDKLKVIGRNESETKAHQLGLFMTS